MQRLLIVNADDFGISEGVNRGILEAHLQGILTSSSVMANMPAFDHAVRLKAEHPTLDVGVHLNITAGVPVLPPSQVPTLVNRKGRFFRIDAQLIRLALGRIDPRQIEAELGAQVERAIRAGLAPSHLDSHHHIHTHPAIQPIVIRIALRYGTEGLRCPAELNPKQIVHLAKPEDLFPRHPVRAVMALGPGFLGATLRRKARAAGLATPDNFRGFMLGLGFSSGDLQGTLSRLPEGSTELMCHPGYPDSELAQQTTFGNGRESELKALLDTATREVLNQKGIRLGTYPDLQDVS